MKRAIRIAGWIYLTGAVLMALSVATFHIFGMEHMDLRALVLILLWPIAVVVFVLGTLGIVNLSE